MISAGTDLVIIGVLHYSSIGVHIRTGWDCPRKVSVHIGFIVLSHWNSVLPALSHSMNPILSNVVVTLSQSVLDLFLLLQCNPEHQALQPDISNHIYLVQNPGHSTNVVSYLTAEIMGTLQLKLD